MKLKTIATSALLGLVMSTGGLFAQDSISPKPQPRLTIGGYGEAVYTRTFYSDNMYRYSHAASYKDAQGHGRLDLPHVVINLGYDFGKGWTMGSEIEFEHGGNEVAVEIEAEETGEFEHEIERGSEVALEQFWIQKSFGKGFDIRTGWCRTTPLWGRGLSAICTGASDRLHDCRARNVIEAIMWHGNAQSDARRTVEKFRALDKADREAIVKFIEAI